MTANINLIKLLPEHISNQIAAGEVVQRPSNIVKELMENSIDAQATQINVVLKNGGKTYLEVSDNGSGINKLDAQMAFERHATSKIKNIDDLFAIKTMGFRGEALASIVAVAQVEMNTRTKENETGIQLRLEQSKLIQQESCVRDIGTSIIVKNLFFYVPARKHFLKTDQTEFKHVVTEFIRIALSYPAVGFSLTHNTQKLFSLTPSNLKQRIVELFGKSYDKNILAVDESLDGLSFSGYVGKPSIAKKSRNENFLIINNRFVRSPLIHRAILNAYTSLLNNEQHPFYVLHIQLDPKSIDINIHPSKQEIKFADEKWVFAFIQSHIKYALAKSNTDSPLQFNLDTNIQSLPIVQSGQNTKPISKSSISKSFETKDKAHYIERDWKKEIEDLVPKIESPLTINPSSNATTTNQQQLDLEDNFTCTQLLQSFLLIEQEKKSFIIDQKYAHQHILYHKYKQQIEAQQNNTQTKTIATKLTQPLIISVSPTEMITVEEYSQTFKQLGFQLEQVGLHDIAIYTTPIDIHQNKLEFTLRRFLEEIAYSKPNSEKSHFLALGLAKTSSYKKNQRLNNEQQQLLLKQLFCLENKEYTTEGNRIIRTLDTMDIEHWMRN